MNFDTSPPRPAADAENSDAIRRQVVEVAAELMRGTLGPGTPGFSPDASDQSAMNLYLALLMDRLPVLARTLTTMMARVGEASVEENLVPVADATVQFYCEILTVKVNVLTKPDQLVQLRSVLRARDFGPQRIHGKIAVYLEEERRLGRIPADVDCEACAQLLLGTCLNYAFTKLLLDEAPPRDAFARRAVRALRLGV